MKRTTLNAQIGGLDGPSLLKLMEAEGDPGILRPFQHDGKCYVELFNKNTGKRVAHRVPHNTATLPHEVWLEIDQTVTRAMRKRLKAVGDLEQAGLVRNIPNGFAVQALMTQRASRIGTANLAMDPMQTGPKDRPVNDTVLLPLPCIWADWGFGARELAVSRRGGLPLDLASAEDQAYACAELAEKMLIGNSDYDEYQYVANAKIYGYTDFTSRVTSSLTAPTALTWTGTTLLDEILTGIQALVNVKKYGPYMVYLAPAWSRYLENDYVSTTAGQTTTITTRERILKHAQIQDIRELDNLTGWDVLIVQMETETVREVVGMDWTTVQWEEQGGQVLNWRIMGIRVPQIRSDYDGNCGICHMYVGA